MSDIADGNEWKMPSTIEDSSVMPEIEKTLATLGYPIKTKE